jgi:pimeloyl-ACP methyl ester carboxylesterase
MIVLKHYAHAVFMFIVTLLLNLPLTGCSGGQSTPLTPTPTMAAIRAVFPESDPFYFQLIRTAGAAPSAANLAECLDTANRIREKKKAFTEKQTKEIIDLWYSEWYGLAERVRSLGERFEAFGDAANARNAYSRASNYYRNAGFFLSEKPLDPRTRDTWNMSVGIFRKAAALFSPQIEYLQISYENTTIPAYFYRAGTTAEQRPTLIIHQGFDGSKEESIPSGLAAQRHGYNCIIFDGPGQGEMIHDQGIPFRPDWEKVVTPIVDYLVKRPDVDPNRIALIGFSMGGYLAPRAATAEKRLKAVVADGGVYSVFEGVAEAWLSNWAGIPEMPQNYDQFLAFINEYPASFNGMVYQIMENSIGLSWSMNHGMYTFDVGTPAEYYLKLAEMTLEGRIQNISAQVLVVDSEKDTTFPKQPQKLYANLPGHFNAFLMFTEAEGAELHCQAGASDIFWKKAFAWLDTVLK